MAENERASTPPNFAVLIDGDNANAGLLVEMMEEVGKHGVPTVRRVYGDWTDNRLQQWKKVLHEHAVQPVQQFRYVAGKNSTDSAMIIDAMDILYAGSVGAFCLVSSDSDYTRLATRLREAGKFVMGIGDKKTPKPLVRACNVFVYTENLGETTPRPTSGPRPKPKRSDGADDRTLKSLLVRAFELVEEEDGWTNLGRLGNALQQLDPGFDPRTWGHNKLLNMIQDLPDLFEVDIPKGKGSRSVYVRLRY